MNRREFIGMALATTGALAAGAVAGSRLQAVEENTLASGTPSRKTVKHGLKATSKVPLGKTGLKVSLVGIGTGSIGWAKASNQTRLGDAGFTRLMRHALDNGITFFDTADQYGSNPFFGRAMKGVPRGNYVLQTKLNSRDAAGARADIDRMLKELNTDYIDSLIVHCVTECDWSRQFAAVREVFSQAKQAGKIRAHGVTCHSFEALQDAYASDWVQVNMVRWNAYQAHMDNNVEKARELFTQMRRKGQGMIGMKVVGQGDLLNGWQKKTPEECYRFQIESGVVDAFIVGCESTQHIDQLLSGTQKALDELGYRTSV